MIRWLLGLELIDGWVLPGFGILIVALLVVVTGMKPRHPVRVAIGAASGAAIAVALVVTSDALDMFDVPIPAQAVIWATVGLTAAGAGIASLWGGPWWRTALAGILILASVVWGALGVNRTFGITHTLAAIIGVQALSPVALPTATPSPSSTTSPPYETWVAPAGMRAKGVVGALAGANRIPSPGFAARDAAVYLPPAALVAHPPRLPLIVFMMGQPGSPDPTALAKVLDAFAAAHHGLAPIAIVADQLASPVLDPACHDSTTYGAVSTYFNIEIPAYARTHLNIIDDSASWVIGGYSNGGACALLWGSQHPEIWGNVLDVSGNEFPGSEAVGSTIAKVFAGDRAAFEAAKPAAVMAANAGRYDGHTAVFTSGGDDTRYGPGLRANAEAASAAGFTVEFETVPGAGHIGPALDGGLALAIPALGTAVGLSPP
ncbi:alpha/beta hydrolase [Microbacterium deminutum]|uniref:Alpha/beta hydrolase-fold protein n=1 Tax=Microbacterium deminutum TaxID=344164 RepID=A0ABP5BLH8_9MICO